MLAVKHRSRTAPIAVAVVAIAWMMPVLTHGQADRPAAQGAANPAAPAGTYQAPRTPWGDPDFQGVWDSSGGGPAQAEASLPPEVGQRLVQARASRYDPADKFRSVRGLSKEKPKLVDPPDGLFPLLPGKFLFFDTRRRADHWTQHEPTERCITSGVPSVFVEGDAHHIVQSPGWVVILSENIHNVREIPTDGRPHLSSTISLWDGDPRGRWEGGTLVVETTNFNDKGWVIHEIGGGVQQSSQERILERWTRVARDMIRQEITVTDPTVFSRPWTAVISHKLQGPQYFVVEYACHEGNWNYMAGSLRQGRLREQQGVQAGTPASKP